MEDTSTASATKAELKPLAEERERKLGIVDGNEEGVVPSSLKIPPKAVPISIVPPIAFESVTVKYSSGSTL